MRGFVCVLRHKSQFGELRIFHLARLLLLFNENIKAFLQKINIFDGRQLISKFQFLIVVFITFCCSDESSVFCSFNFVIDVMISFWISLSSVDFETFAFAERFTMLSFLFFIPVISNISPMVWFFEDFKVFLTVRFGYIHKCH